jgi:hypothetical protein
MSRSDPVFGGLVDHFLQTTCERVFDVAVVDD